VNGLTMTYGSFVIQRDLDFIVERGEVFIIMGGSGSGKSTLLNHMIGLKQPARGDVAYDGESFWASTPSARDRLRRRSACHSRGGALSSMTLAENVGLPLQTFTRLPAQIREIVCSLALVGLAGYEEFYLRDQRRDVQAPGRAGHGARPTSSSTSRPRGSIRSARAGSTISSSNCATASAPPWW
jgi:ABC-type transporter Mla maintaining outer membrane lipid asymmetry ATPase subunit MlaF